MDLIQVAASGAGGLRDLTLTPDAVARLEVRVSPVLRQPASNHLTFLGRVTPDERKLTTTTARMDGRLDRLFIDYTGISVRTGDHLAEIYSPDLFIAQQELIQAKRHLAANHDRTRQALYRASREKISALLPNICKLANQHSMTNSNAMIFRSGNQTIDVLASENWC